MIKNIIQFIAIVLFCTPINSQTSGPEFIKNSLTASGVYNAPNFEFTTAYDSYNTSTAAGTIKGMFFDGLPYSKALNTENKTKVFCWYGEPEGLVEGEKVPAVILIHGGGGRAYTAWVDKWINKGYIAIALSLRGTVPDDSETWTYGGPSQEYFFSDNDEALGDQWFYHAIANAMLANSLLRDTNFTSHVDTNHIGVTGISWGGINNTVLAGIDERLDFIIPVYGCGYLFDSPIYSNQLSRMTSTAQNFYLENWEPSLYAPLHTAPMLFVNGNKDLQFTLNVFTETFEASASPDKYLRIEDVMPHGHAAGWTPEEIYDFANYITGFDSSILKPVEFTSETIDENLELNYNYNYEGALTSAILYYCTDVREWGKFDEEFEWKTINATITEGVNSGNIVASLPEAAQVYYINVNTTDGLMYSSAMKYNGNIDETETPIIETDYSWLDYTELPAFIGINKYRDVGGVYTENHDLSLDAEITANGSTSNIANKFIKTAGDYKFAQIDYNFTDGTIENSSVTFVLNALFKPETIDEINILDEKSRSVTLFLKNAAGDNTDTVNQISKTAYFTQTNTWEELSFTFTDDNLSDYDRMYIMFAKDYTNPIDEDGLTLDEDLVYYFDELKSDVKCELCEEIAPKNLALNGTARQSSTLHDGVASGAIDDNTNGAYSDGSVTHTASETNAYWQVTLDDTYNIGDINIFGRTDSCCLTRLSNFTVLVYDESTRNFAKVVNSYPDPSITVNANGAAGNIIRVRSNTGASLSLAEVQVFESSSSSALKTKTKVDSNQEITPFIYPNPVKTSFQLNTINIQGVRIYNISGQQVKHFNKPQSSYSVSDLNSGIYFVKISTPEKLIINKLIKK
ncbi:T9SS type A sorting domain-containing protein [Flavivirga aquimarina]|uniref:T9SS type A sorting domain-containing protein n=1 Tax=Flavivirga aquimarina TaxID=2027862 RepID=A0ABT8W8Y8_9FLAO|nr:T9SS type A sorting domain-containing protein [Flavivirga aquimarina]MDO5969598.1 T9SS type A sorting domain-containing protein [Flavivirga aquimarina]